MYGKVTQNWDPFNASWALMEKYMIPTHADQPTNSFYDPSKPATYAAEHPLPSDYPSAIDGSVPVGQDPIASELKSAYGTDDIYGMHWLQDVDNVYGYGNTPGGGCEEGPDADGPSYINTYQRGSQESVFETVPQPTCDKFAFGGTNGYLDLFIDDSSYAEQCKFTDAPTPTRAPSRPRTGRTSGPTTGQVRRRLVHRGEGRQDGRLPAVLVLRQVLQEDRRLPLHVLPRRVGQEQRALPAVLVLRVGARDRLQRRLGVAPRRRRLALRLPEPLAAYALVNDPALAPKGATAKADWKTSLTRQLH